ncbi:MAG TPA: hypothetical protein VJS66_06255 [Burkholderiales bacterium]|nr:hypothetical protein [Burkholderiales bacterium]
MIEPGRIPSARPASVAGAVKLLYATLGVGILRGVLEFQAVADSAPMGFVLTVWALTMGAMLMLFYHIGAGRNWARITLLALFVLGLPFAIQPLLQSLASQPVFGALGVVQMAAQITALALLFRPESNAWFRKPKKSEKDTASVEF